MYTEMYGSLQKAYSVHTMRESFEKTCDVGDRYNHVCNLLLVREGTFRLQQYRIFTQMLHRYGFDRWSVSIYLI